MGQPVLEVQQTETAKRRRRGGQRVDWESRGQYFKRLKTEHPDWSYAKVALESDSEELGEVANEHMVRNTYRMLGWKWERADRTR